MTTDVAARGIAQIFIKVDGRLVADRLLDDLARATVESSVHLPDMALLEFNNSDFEWSDAEPLKIGQELRIELGSEQNKREVFVGEVTSLELDMSIDGSMRLSVRGYDRAHRLQRGRETKVYKRMSDSAIAQRIAREQKLTADVERTSQVHDYVMQDNQTDWDFLQDRARRVGFELQVKEKTLVFKPPPSTPAEAVDLTLDESLLAFRVRMAAREQVTRVEVRGWDPLNKREIVGIALRPQTTTTIQQRRTGGNFAKAAFKDGPTVVIARQPVHDQAQAKRLAQAALDELEQSFVTAEGVALGDPRLRLGSKVNLKHVGKQFTGTYVVTELRHLYEPTGYRNEFVVSGRRSTDVFSLLTPPAVRGTQMFTGIVTNNSDDQNNGRVKVKLPTLGDDVESHWCRVVAPGAGKDRGIEFLPEVDDEVLVVGTDVDQLYVLGGLWNQKDAPPEPTKNAIASGRVNKRLIRSRNGHTIVLDDGDDGGISIIDSTGNNRIVIATRGNGLEITAAGDIKIEAGGKIEISAGTELSLEAGTEFSAKGGTNAGVEAGTQLELKGMTARLQGNTRAEVKAPSVNVGP